MGLLQNDERVKTILKNERMNYRKVKYEFNKKRHFMGNTAGSTDQYKEEEQVSKLLMPCLDYSRELSLLIYVKFILIINLT